MSRNVLLAAGLAAGVVFTAGYGFGIASRVAAGTLRWLALCAGLAVAAGIALRYLPRGS